ncbi:MAG TPA: lactate racemase domain-containing protein [Chloroflexota bacterium]
MGRPGFVLHVDERTPPLVVHAGEGFHLETFPIGTRVIYPPEPLPALRDVDAAIRAALTEPLESDPLPALLRAGMRLTIAFDDISLPLPPMRPPDIRGRVIEHVLELAAAAGVDDVRLIAATSLHRRMSAAELREVLGERVFRSFWPESLTNHDAEDPCNLVCIGRTERGEVVEINRRAAESDLLVYVNINLVPMDGGHKSVPVGLSSYRSLRHHHNVRTMLASHSYMDPPHSALHASTERMGRLLADQIPIFTVETTLDNRTFPSPVEFLNRREWEWSMRDQMGFVAARQASLRAPASVRHRMFHTLRAPYGLTGINAGSTEPVHARTLDRLHQQQLVQVEGQADVLVAGVPYLGPYNVNSIMNPILAYCTGLGYLFNMYRGRPLVRAGGAMILFHPLRWEFDTLRHPSYVDFFEEVLAETTDPAEIETRFEERYACDEWYRHLYRTGYAYHGVHPFYMWYWGAHARAHLGQVIFVGAERRSAARLGFRSASTLADALEMAADSVGRSPRVTYLHTPPLLLADVHA